MSHEGVRYGQVHSVRALLEAYRKASRAKATCLERKRFYLGLEREVDALSLGLESRTWEPDPYRYFRLEAHKSRVVSIASFRDRVVHHALVGALEPEFERAFLPHSYACRKGKGVHSSVAHVQGLVRRSRYMLRMTRG